MQKIKVLLTKKKIETEKQMNNQNKILMDITSYIDGYGLTENERSEIKNRIENDPRLNFEYQIQYSMKNLVSKRIDRAKTPAYLINNIVSKTIESDQKNNFNNVFESVKNFFLTPKYSLAIATAMLIFTVVYSIFNFTPNLNNSFPNLFTQAEQNFSNIVLGELKPQILCDNSSEVQEFFKSEGVAYSTLVPEFREWDLIGAVVSEEKGQKLAHHVYADNNGHLIYLYQVNEDHLTSNKLVELSPEMLTNLNSRGVVKFKAENHSTFLFKHQQNVFALVSNDDDIRIEDVFISALLQSNTI
jgi:hypothetical protein